jgi:hypothetical protein
MYQHATSPRSIGQVLDSVFKLMKPAFVPLIGYAIIGAVISLAPWIYMYQQGVLENPLLMIEMFSASGFWVVILVMMPLNAIVGGAALLRTQSIARGEASSFGESLKGVGGHVVALILGMLGYLVAVMIGTVLLIVPGIILMISLAMFLPAIVLGGKGAIDGLKYSHKLVWGNWWRTATVYTIGFIIMYVLMLVIGVVLGLAFAFTGTDLVATMLVDAASSIISGLVAMPFFCALLSEIYTDLRMRKSGDDLGARIEATSAVR